MAERIACESCGKPIDPRHAVCPLCGHLRRPRAEIGRSSLDDPKPGDNEPPRLLPRFDPSGADVPVTDARSAFERLVRPAPHTRGWMRAAELVLTAIGFPFFVSSVIVLLPIIGRWERLDFVSWLGGGVLGSVVVGLGLPLVGVDSTVAIKVALAGLGAWTLRSVVRALSNLRARG